MPQIVLTHGMSAPRLNFRKPLIQNRLFRIAISVHEPFATLGFAEPIGFEDTGPAHCLQKTSAKSVQFRWRRSYSLLVGRQRGRGGGGGACFQAQNLGPSRFAEGFCTDSVQVWAQRSCKVPIDSEERGRWPDDFLNRERNPCSLHASVNKISRHTTPPTSRKKDVRLDVDPIHHPPRALREHVQNLFEHPKILTRNDWPRLSMQPRPFGLHRFDDCQHFALRKA